MIPRQRNRGGVASPAQLGRHIDPTDADPVPGGAGLDVHGDGTAVVPEKPAWFGDPDMSHVGRWMGAAGSRKPGGTEAATGTAAGEVEIGRAAKPPDERALSSNTAFPLSE